MTDVSVIMSFRAILCHSNMAEYNYASMKSGRKASRVPTPTWLHAKLATLLLKIWLLEIEAIESCATP
jgi:hypothetical protein